MEPKSLSATAIGVAELCMARFLAESIGRTPGIRNSAAQLGSSVHNALELYVKVVYLEKTQEAGIKLLLDLFRMSYMAEFSTGDTDTVDYADGVEMLQKWFLRDHVGSSEVVTCEVKKNFPINTPIGPIPFNYILDRFDRIRPGEYRVVDYKTNRAAVRPDELRRKIQPRAYALAMQIEYPDAQRIWVEFDMLRHDGPVGIVFSKEDNQNTWRFLKAKAKQIVETRAADVVETLNPECNYCVRKLSCGALQKNIAGGGIFSLGGAQELVDVRAQLEWQLKGLKTLVDQVDEIILGESKETDVIEYRSDSNRMEIGLTSSRRTVSGDRAQLVLGPELWAKHGSASLSMATVDKLLKGTELTDGQKAQLRGLISKGGGNVCVKVSPLNPMED